MGRSVTSGADSSSGERLPLSAWFDGSANNRTVSMPDGPKSLTRGMPKRRQGPTGRLPTAVRVAHTHIGGRM